MLAFLGAIPIIGQIITAFTTAMFNAKVKLVQARTGADLGVAVEMVKASALQEHENTSKLAILASNPLLTFMLAGFALPLIIFFWKVVVVDKVLGTGCIDLYYWKGCWLGKTDELNGNAGDWATTIIGFLFGSGTTLAVGKMYFGRDKTGE